MDSFITNGIFMIVMSIMMYLTGLPPFDSSDFLMSGVCLIVVGVIVGIIINANV